MRSEPFGIDLSSHNGGVSVETLRKFRYPIRFAWARTGESYAWQDPKFIQYRDIFENQLGVWFGGYHVLYPGEPGAAQAKNMIRIAGKGLPGYACDAELIHGQTPTKIRTEMGNFVQEILMAGLPAWGYTSPGWANTWILPYGVAVPAWMEKIKWWLGQYLTFPEGYTGYDEHPGPVMAMNGVRKDQVYIHQTTSSLPGKDAGQPASSPRLDGNRMLIDFLGGYVKPEPEPIEEVKADTLLFEALCLVSGLNIRTTPTDAVNTNKTGQYCVSGKTYPVYEVSGAWWRIGVDRWACSSKDGKTFLQKVASKTELTDAQKLDLLWWAHPELHA